MQYRSGRTFLKTPVSTRMPPLRRTPLQMPPALKQPPYLCLNWRPLKLRWDAWRLEFGCVEPCVLLSRSVHSVGRRQRHRTLSTPAEHYCLAIVLNISVQRTPSSGTKLFSRFVSYFSAWGEVSVRAPCQENPVNCLFTCLWCFVFLSRSGPMCLPKLCNVLLLEAVVS